MNNNVPLMLTFLILYRFFCIQCVIFTTKWSWCYGSLVKTTLAKVGVKLLLTADSICQRTHSIGISLYCHTSIHWQIIWNLQYDWRESVCLIPLIILYFRVDGPSCAVIWCGAQQNRSIFYHLVGLDLSTSCDD